MKKSILEEKWFKCIVIIGFVIGVVAVLWYNLKKNNDFFEMSIAELITLLIAIVISYFLTEKNSNLRKRKETIEMLIEKKQLKLESGVMIEIKDEEDVKRVNLYKRSIDNNLLLLKNNAQNIVIENDISYVVEQFNNYLSLIDNHIDDIPYLQKSKLDMERFLLLMSDKLNKIRIDLY